MNEHKVSERERLTMNPDSLTRMGERMAHPIIKIENIKRDRKIMNLILEVILKCLGDIQVEVSTVWWTYIGSSREDFGHLGGMLVRHT